eukprot:scaffold7494_cov243-Skeletonema_marinoi.AAC.1
MANYDGTLEAVDCHINSVRYDMAVNRGAGGHLRCVIRVRYDMAVDCGACSVSAGLIRSPTTL